MTREEPTPEEQERWDLEQIKQRHSRLFARPISSVMRRLLSQKGYGAIESTNELEQAWTTVVGDRLARNTRVGKISKGVLLIEVNNSLVMQEVYFQKSSLLKQLQKQLPNQAISDLKFRQATFG